MKKELLVNYYINILILQVINYTHLYSISIYYFTFDIILTCFWPDYKLIIIKS